MFETKKTRGVDPKEVHFCRLCGAEVVQLKHANGHLYWTTVQQHRSHRYIILGEGNHFNFKPEHNCLKEAEYQLSMTESSYREFLAKYEAARTTIEHMDESDRSMKVHSYDIDEQLAAVMQRVRTSAETNLKTLEAQKPGQDQQINRLHQRVELLRQGKTVIPADKPAIGRVARVIKGRKVPAGTQGVIFWMGLDQFKEDGIRVGIENNGQKYYTDSANIEIIQ